MNNIGECKIIKQIKLEDFEIVLYGIFEVHVTRALQSLSNISFKQGI